MRRLEARGSRFEVLFLALALLMSVAGCECRNSGVRGVEDCANSVDDDDNGLVDCRDPVCVNVFPCNRNIDSGFAQDSGQPDAGQPEPDAGEPEDAGTIVYADACPGLAYTPVCGPDAGSGWRRVVTRASDSLFTNAWVHRDGGELFVGGHSVYRWDGGTLSNDLPDAGLYIVRLEGAAPDDLWGLSAEASDGARLLHRTDAGWVLVARSLATPNDLALAGDVPWMLLPNAVARAVDGGLTTWPLPPGTTGLLLSAEPNGELWIGGNVTPCPGLADGGMCPRVVHGTPGDWFVDDWPCLAGSSAGYVWRRTPNEQVVTGGGFLVRRIDAGWMQPEPVPFSGARMAGTANDAWITAYDLLLGSTASGVAHFNGCVERPIFLYGSTTGTAPDGGVTYGVAAGGGRSWAVGGSFDVAQQRWRGDVWASP
jgi:hypothetical protein